MLVVAAFALSCTVAAADVTHSYPNRPLRLMVPSAAGGSGDVIARVMANGLSKRLGHRVVIENHGCGREIAGMEVAARAKPDGYTLILGSAIINVLAPLALEVGYDPAEDFDPVTQVAIMPYVWATPAMTKVESVRQLIALAKSRQRPLSYSSMGDPLGQIGMRMLEQASDVNSTRWQHRGSASLAQLLHGAEVDVVFAGAGAVLPYVNSGALRAIAVSAAKRAAALPDVPTIAESGYPGFEITDWFALFVPRDTPAEIIHRLHVEAANVALTDPVKLELLRTGAEPLTSVSNVDVLRRMRSESAKYVKAVSRVNFKPGRPGKPMAGPPKH
jgi:tripartite-type tricarboxylate transporter receptor subunit TctC